MFKPVIDALIKSNNPPQVSLIYGEQGSFLRQACDYFASLYKPYVIWVDEPERIGIPVIRNLQESLRLGCPDPSKKLMVIILQADTLTLEASNALLKNLEEPVEGIFFVLATYKLEKMIPTVVSRSQKIHIPKIEPHEVSAVLPYENAEKQSTYEALAKQSKSLFYSVVESQEPFELHYESFDKVLAMNDFEKMSYAKELSENKKQAQWIFNAWIETLLKNEAQKPYPVIAKNLQILIENIQQMQYNLNIRLHFENLFFSFTAEPI